VYIAMLGNESAGDEYQKRTNYNCTLTGLSMRHDQMDGCHLDQDEASSFELQSRV
jgi:hypothetical protein